MSVDSIRIEDMYRGTEAEIVDHFSNKNKSIAQMQAVVGTLAVATDTNRIMMFTGPNVGNASRGDFSWSAFSTLNQFTLDDQVVGQYNPYVWFAADHVSNEYLTGGTGTLREAIKTEHLGDTDANGNQITVRNLKLAAADNGGTEVDLGGHHWQQRWQASWNSSIGAYRNHPGIVVDPNKFLRMHNKASIWMGCAAGSDHAESNGTGDYYKTSANYIDKQYLRGSDWGSHAIPRAEGVFNYDGHAQPYIVSEDGRKYLRTSEAYSGQGSKAQTGFTIEYSDEYNEPKVIFQVVKVTPGTPPDYVSMAPKVAEHAHYGHYTRRSGYKADKFSFGSTLPDGSTVHGQTYSYWNAWRGPGTEADAGHYYYPKSAPTDNSQRVSSSNLYHTAWGFDQAFRPLVHDTSAGGGANISTLTHNWTSLANELNTNGTINLEGNIIHVDNNDMPDHIVQNSARYDAWTPANGWHTYNSKQLDLGWQSFYLPKSRKPQMRVYAGGDTYTAFTDERINGFSSRMFRTDINDVAWHTGSGYIAHTRQTGDIVPSNMFDQSVSQGHLMHLGLVGGKNYADDPGIYGQESTGNSSSGQRAANLYGMDIAEIIVVPCPASPSAYKLMVDNIEGYLAAKYGLGGDCSGSVIV